MITVFIQLEELELANECAKMIEWLSRCFFERNSLLYMSMMDQLDSFFDGIGYHLGLKNEMSILIKKALDKHFHLEEMEAFMEKEPIPKTEYGYIPTEKESSVLRELEEQNKYRKDRDSYKMEDTKDLIISKNSPSLLGRKLFKIANKGKRKGYEKPIGGSRRLKSRNSSVKLQNELNSQGSFTMNNLNS